jgi:ribonuclease D
MIKQIFSPPLCVANRSSLEEMTAALACEPRIAIDTESNSLYAYREQVCLIQFSTPSQDYLVDPLALPDLELLSPVFENPAIEKIFHAAEYDLICLKRDFGFRFENIFDTMIAARILGYKKVGLGNLLDQKFNVKVDKKFQKADWGKRPLTDEMLNYARFDTHYLIALRDLFSAELQARQLRELAQEDFGMVAALDGINHRQPLPLWERVGGRAKLSPRQATVLNEVCLARENLAEKLNRPVFKIVGNKSLIKLAEAQPRSRRDLEIEGFTSRQINSFGKTFLAAVEEGRHAELVRRTPFSRPGEEYRNRLERLRHWRKEKAIDLDVESDVVLPRFIMEKIARENPQNKGELAKIMAKSPWRLAQYGDEILDRLRLM